MDEMGEFLGFHRVVIRGNATTIGDNIVDVVLSREGRVASFQFCTEKEHLFAVQSFAAEVLDCLARVQAAS